MLACAVEVAYNGGHLRDRVAARYELATTHNAIPSPEGHAMSTAILADLRHQTQLHGNTFLIATELAHRMNDAGVGRVSYQFLAWKAHCCLRTAVSQVARLIDKHRLFRKQRFRTAHGNAINLYQYIGPRLSRAFPPATTHSATVAKTLPQPKTAEAKESALRDEIAQLRAGMCKWTEGTIPYEACLERLRYLEALL
jgi:hypothetical protein